MSEERIGIYPGTFDPITNGHMDIITRAASSLTDRLIVCVAANAGKNPLFSLHERTELVSNEISNLPMDLQNKIDVQSFDKLLVKHAEEQDATMIVRGLRAVSDFEYEFQMTGMNAKMNHTIETVFLMASEKQQFISSRFVKEICKLGGDIHQFVSPGVAERLKTVYKGQR